MTKCEISRESLGISHFVISLLVSYLKIYSIVAALMVSTFVSNRKF